MSKVVISRTQGQDLRSLPRDPFIPKARTTPKQAKRLILALVEAGCDGALVQVQDGGKKVDIVFSRTHPDQVMTIEESERNMNTAIRNAYKALTGLKVTGDPVDFIND